MLSAGSGVLEAFPGVSRTVNVCVSGPEVSLDGVFCVERYLADNDCIWHEGKWYSRSAFEKASGSHTARWHCSIKVAGHPSKISIGAWLEENGLPVLKGTKRKSRSQRLREVQSRGGSPFAADPTPSPTSHTDQPQPAPPLAHLQPTTSPPPPHPHPHPHPQSFHPPPAYPPQHHLALPHPHALHQLGLSGPPTHAQGNLAPQSTLPVLPSLGHATSLPHTGPRPRHLSPGLAPGGLPQPLHSQPPAPHNTPQPPRRLPPDSTPGVLPQPPHPQPPGLHTLTHQLHGHVPSPLTRGSLPQPPAMHAAPLPSPHHPAPAAVPGSLPPPPTSNQSQAMPQHSQLPFSQPPSAPLLTQHHHHHQALAPAAHPLLQLLQQHQLSPTQQALVLRLLALRTLQPVLAGAHSHQLSPRPSTTSVGVQTEPETDGNGSSTRTTTAATTSAQNPMSTSSAANDHGRAGHHPATVPAPGPGYPAAPPAHSDTAFADYPRHHHRTASLPDASHLAPAHDPTRSHHHPVTGTFSQLQLPDARSFPESMMLPPHRSSAPGRAGWGGRGFGSYVPPGAYGHTSDRGGPHVGGPLPLAYSEGARGGPLLVGHESGRGGPLPSGHDGDRGDPLPAGHEGDRGGVLPAGHEGDRGGLMLDMESDDAAAVLGLHLWEDVPADVAHGGHVTAHGGAADAAWRHVAMPVGGALPPPPPAAAGPRPSGGATDAVGGRRNAGDVTMATGASSGAAAPGMGGREARAMYGGSADPSVGSTRSG